MRPLVTASVVLVAPPGFLLEEWLSQLVAVLLTAIMAMLARSVANWRAVQAAAKAKRDHFWVLRAERDCAVNRVGVRRPDSANLPASLSLIAQPPQASLRPYRCGLIITPKPDTNVASSQSEIISSIRATSRAGSWAAG